MTPRAWLDRLERSFGAWAPPDPALFLSGMNAAVWALSLMKPEFPLRLTLEPGLILSGEVWRLITFLFIPPSMGPVWMIFWLLMFYSVAQALETEWGEFRFSAYYALGAAATVITSTALGFGLSNVPLNLSLFLAFARLFPEVEFLLFFVIPVKVRWLSWAAWALLALHFFTGGLYQKIALLAGLANYLVVFGPEHVQELRRRLKR